MKKQIALVILGVTALVALAQNRVASQPTDVQAKNEARLSELEGKIRSLETRIKDLEEEAQRNRTVLVAPEISISGQKNFR